MNINKEITIEVEEDDSNSFIDHYNRVIGQISDTFNRKHSDYGGSYENQIKRFGIPAIVIPIATKCDRLCTLAQKDYKPKVYESIKDTLQDLANYAIMGLAAYNMIEEMNEKEAKQC